MKVPAPTCVHHRIPRAYLSTWHGEVLRKHLLNALRPSMTSLLCTPPAITEAFLKPHGSPTSSWTRLALSCLHAFAPAIPLAQNAVPARALILLSHQLHVVNTVSSPTKRTLLQSSLNAAPDLWTVHKVFIFLQDQRGWRLGWDQNILFFRLGRGGVCNACEGLRQERRYHRFFTWAQLSRVALLWFHSHHRQTGVRGLAWVAKS